MKTKEMVLMFEKQRAKAVVKKLGELERFKEAGIVSAEVYGEMVNSLREKGENLTRKLYTRELAKKKSAMSKLTRAQKRLIRAERKSQNELTQAQKEILKPIERIELIEEQKEMRPLPKLITAPEVAHKMAIKENGKRRMELGGTKTSLRKAMQDAKNIAETATKIKPQAPLGKAL